VRLTPAVVVASALVLAGPAGAAVAGGSDGPTPYTVTADGVTLPEGRAFVAHGHVNYRVVPLGGGASVELNVHLDPNNGQPGGANVGARTLDFAEAAERFSEGYCVTWVQVEGFDEHFGEGGQEPVCTTVPEEPATPVEPGRPATPPAEVQVPEAPANPVEPAAEEPAATPPAEDEATPLAPSTADDTAPSPVADAATPVTLELEARSASGATADAAEPSDETGLASTGTSTIVALVVGALLVAAGVALLVVRRVRRA